MMTRRMLLKLVALFPLAGPAITQALARSASRGGLAYVAFLPTVFPEWNNAIDGLADAGKWALDIERSRLPKNMTIPSAGEIWATIRPCQAGFRPLFRLPTPGVKPKPGHGFPPAFFTPDRMRFLIGGMTNLVAGEQVRILGTDDPKRPLHVAFQPLRYQEVEQAIVPEEIRASPGYCGYELSVKTARTIQYQAEKDSQTFFGEAFRLVQVAESGQ